MQNGTTLTYNAAQQVVEAAPSAAPPTSFVYDGRGSRASATTAATETTAQLQTTFEYTAAGSLAGVHTPDESIDYTSNAQGLRQSRTADNVTAQFTWSTLGALPLLLSDGEHRYIYGPSTTPLAQVAAGGSIEYLSTDLLGTPRLVTDEAGQVLATSTFDAFGQLTAHTGLTDTRIGFSGNWTDPDTGLLYLRARDYDPTTGQFLTVDPAVDTTRQPYAYTGNNPVQRTDPTGLDFGTEVGNNAIAGAAGALDGFTGGISSAIAGSVIPGYDCFIQKYNTAFQTGSVLAQVLPLLIPGVGLAVAGVSFLARSAARFALRQALRAAERTTVRVIESSGAAVVSTVRLTGARMSESAIVGSGRDYATQSMILYSKKNPEAGLFDVIGHGSPNSIAGQSAAEVGSRIQQTSGGQSIRLLSCQTGCPTGSFAQDLANVLGVRVKAPTTDIGASSRGNTLEIFDGGEWRWFLPQL